MWPFKKKEEPAPRETVDVQKATVTFTLKDGTQTKRTLQGCAWRNMDGGVSSVTAWNQLNSSFRRALDRAGFMVVEVGPDRLVPLDDIVDVRVVSEPYFVDPDDD
jgi:hypothetical protein